MAEKSYAEQIAEYRAHRHEREALERRVELEREHAELIAQRDAVEDGDTDTFDFIDRQLEDIETEHGRLVPAPPPTPAFTETEQEVIRQHSPAQFGQTHWTQQSKFNTGQKLSNEEIVRSGAAYAQSRFIQERAQRGLQTTAEDLTAYRDSPDYKAALEFFAPQEQGGLPTADSIVEDIRKTSKYGRDFDGKKYNQQVRAMDRAGKRGQYDR